MFEGYSTSVASLDSRRDRRISSPLQPTRNTTDVQLSELATPANSNQDSGVALGSQSSDVATMSPRGLLYESTSSTGIYYQMAPVNYQGQYFPLVQHPVEGSILNQGQHLCDLATDQLFDDQMFEQEIPPFNQPIQYSTMDDIGFQF